MTNQTPTPEQEHPGKVIAVAAAWFDAEANLSGTEKYRDFARDLHSAAAYVSELEARADAYAPALKAIRHNAMPLYSCIETGCAEEHSFHAGDLALCNEGPVCEECWSELSSEDGVAWHDLPPFIPPWAEDIATEAARADAAEAESARLWKAMEPFLCDDCPRVGHSTDSTRCSNCPRAALSSQSSTGQNDGQPALSGTDGGPA